MLVSFNITNGGYPNAGLVEGSDGNFYGATSGGGVSACGTVFKMTPIGVLTTLYSFGGTTSAYPHGTPAFGSDGKLYGTSQQMAIWRISFTLPTVMTGATSEVTVSSVTLTSTVNANDSDATVSFQFGLTNSYGNTVAGTPSPVTGNSAATVSAALTGLQPGTLYHFRTVATNLAGSIQSNDATFVTALSSLQQWKLAQLGDANASDLADPDHDGLVNLVEFAYGLDPTSSGSLQLPQPQVVGDAFTLTFAQPVGITGITYGAEWNSVLSGGSWQPVADTGTGSTHTFSVAKGSLSQIFMRLIVTSP